MSYPPPPAQPYAGADPVPHHSGHPVQMTIERAPTQNRVFALFSLFFFFVRIIAAIPVVICLYFVGIALYIVAWIGMWAVLFSGSYPEGMHRFCTGVMRWQLRTSAFIFGLTDTYPGFSMQP